MVLWFKMSLVLKSGEKMIYDNLNNGFLYIKLISLRF